MNLQRVVVTGLGSLTPIGNDVSTMWSSMLAGVSGASLITRFDPTNFKCKIACEVKGYDPLNHFDRKEYKKLDLFSQYGIVASEEAIIDSELKDENIDLFINTLRTVSPTLSSVNKAPIVATAPEEYSERLT